MTRIRVIMSRVLMLVGMMLLCGCQVTLYSDISEQDANEMLALLRSNGVATEKLSAGKGLWNLMVDESALSRSLELLSGAGLPKTRYQSMGDVFRKDSMVSTPVEEQARMLYALSQELAGTIAQIDGVLTARVHIVLPEVDSFGNKISPSSASVFIRHRSDVELTPHVTAIKRMVGNSVRNLQYDAVTVFLFPSTVVESGTFTPRQVSVFGLTVNQESADLVRNLCFGGVGLFVLLLGLACWLLHEKGLLFRKRTSQEAGS